jgi:hypothetical protein
MKHDELVFRLSLHITYPVALLSKEPSQRPALLPFIDTAFTHYPSCKNDLQVACLYDARSTIEICAQGYFRYTVYAFFDVIHGMEPLGEMDATDFSYEDISKASPRMGVHEDPIASGAPLDANLPIMDARDYGLRILNWQLAKAVKHWSDAIELMKEPFGAHVRYGLDMM